MNQQREVVYEYRDEILEGRDMGDAAREQMREVVRAASSSEYTPGDFIEDWDVDGLFTQVQQIFDAELRPGRRSRPSRSTARSSIELLARGRAGALRAAARRSSARSSCARSSATCCCRSSTSAGASTCYDMDYLREGIHLRGFAQIDPLVAYKNEAFTLFQRPHELDLGGLRAR